MVVAAAAAAVAAAAPAARWCRRAVIAATVTAAADARLTGRRSRRPKSPPPPGVTVGVAAVAAVAAARFLVRQKRASGPFSKTRPACMQQAVPDLTSPRICLSPGGAGAHLSGLNKLFFGYSILDESVLGPVSPRP